jgi:hypothetical protein
MGEDFGLGALGLGRGLCQPARMPRADSPARSAAGLRFVQEIDSVKICRASLFDLE